MEATDYEIYHFWILLTAKIMTYEELEDWSTDSLINYIHSAHELIEQSIGEICPHTVESLNTHYFWSDKIHNSSTEGMDSIELRLIEKELTTSLRDQIASLQRRVQLMYQIIQCRRTQQNA